MESIILAGGLGTRLQGVIGAYPKCMAPVNGRPFLSYLLEYLSAQGCSRAILSLGFKHEVVIEWLQTQKLSFPVDYVIETEPLGTGGGIQLAMREAKTTNVTVLNGDTMFMVDIKELMQFHTDHHAATTLALKLMHNFDRYGVVNTDAANHVTSFEEKQQRDTGLINGGVYVINKDKFFSKQLPHQFSFENHYLEAFVADRQYYGYNSDAYFIDIGIPVDYTQAQEDFKSIFP